MKSATTNLENFLPTATEMIVVDLYTFSLLNGQVLRYSSADVDVVWSGRTYLGKSAAARIQRSRLKQRFGLNTNDEMKLQMFYDTTVVYGGLSLPQLIMRGDFRQALVEIDRLFMQTWGDQTLGTIVWWKGRVGPVDPITRSGCTMAVRSIVELLNIQMPRNVMQSGCRWTLFDAGCTLNPASFVVHATTTSGSTTQMVNATGLAQANGYFTQGKMVFTSGSNAGQIRNVELYTVGVVVPTLPLPFAPLAGDTFDIYPGCDKQQATCQVKFSNLTNFGGMPYIPKPEAAL